MKRSSSLSIVKETPSILCVDSNNIHGIIMEKFFEKIFDEMNSKAEVSSVCINDKVGSINQHTLETMKKYGIDISEHFTQSINEYNIEKFDYIFCVDSNVKNYLIKRGVLENKIIILSEDIPNPYGKDKISYTSCADLIHLNITNMIKQMNF